MKRNAQALCFLLATLSCSFCEAQEALSLPTAFEHATITVYEQPKASANVQGLLDFAYEGQSLGTAAGNIAVASDAFVGIEIKDGDGMADYVAALPADGIHRLDFRRVTITQKLMKDIERIGSLQQLYFFSCEFESIDPETLRGLPKLATIQSVQQREKAREAHPVLAQWASKCERLQYFYDGVPPNETEIRRFNEHQSPLFLHVSLGENADAVMKALGEIPYLVGLNLQIEKEAGEGYHEWLPNLKSLDLVNWSNGVLDLPLLNSLEETESLRTLRFQGSISVEDDFIENVSQLQSLKAISFNFSLSDYQSQVLNQSLIEMPNIESMPRLVHATGEQLDAIAKHRTIRSIEIDGLSESASESDVAAMLDAHPEISHIGLSEIDLTDELSAAISACQNVENLDLGVANFDGDSLRSLSSLRSLNLRVSGQAKGLDAIGQLSNLTFLSLQLGAVDPQEWAFIGKSKSLKSLSLFQVHFDDSLAAHVRSSKSLRSIDVNGSTLKAFLSRNGLQELSKSENLESVTAGGFCSPSEFLILAKLPNLKRLSLFVPDTGQFDSEKIERLKKGFDGLEYFETFKMRGVAAGDDGVLRKLPRNGRTKLDKLEGTPLQQMLQDQMTPELKEQLNDRVVLVKFWGTWCGPCLSFEPELERLHEKFAHDGLAILGIHSKQDADSAIPYLDKNPKPWLNLVDTDGSLAETFAVPSWPSIYVFDKDGKLLQAAAYRYGLDQHLESLLK